MSRKRHRRLSNLNIASPCSETWDAMPGDAVRRCGKCEKQVHDLAALTANAAEALLSRKGGVCVRFTRAEDGSVVTREDARLPRAKPPLTMAAALLVAGAGCSAEPATRPAAPVTVEPQAQATIEPQVSPLPQPVKASKNEADVMAKRHVMGEFYDGPRTPEPNAEDHRAFMEFVRTGIERTFERCCEVLAEGPRAAGVDAWHRGVIVAWKRGGAVRDVKVREAVSAAFSRCVERVVRAWPKPKISEKTEAEFPVVCKHAAVHQPPGE